MPITTPPTSGTSPSVDMADLSRIKRMGNTKEGLRAATKEFESLFLYQLLASMRQTVEKNPVFHGGRAEEIFEDMLDQELSRGLATAGGIGIADVMYQQLERQAEYDTQRSDQQHLGESLAARA